MPDLGPLMPQKGHGFHAVVSQLPREGQNWHRGRLSGSAALRGLCSTERTSKGNSRPATEFMISSPFLPTGKAESGTLARLWLDRPTTTGLYFALIFTMRGFRLPVSKIGCWCPGVAKLAYPRHS